jgi:hypothetical protein
MRCRLRGAYVAELAEAKLAKGGNNLPTNLVGDIELYHAHLRRAERGVRLRSHGDAAESTRAWELRWLRGSLMWCLRRDDFHGTLLQVDLTGPYDFPIRGLSAVTWNTHKVTSQTKLSE